MLEPVSSGAGSAGAAPNLATPAAAPGTAGGPDREKGAGPGEGQGEPGRERDRGSRARSGGDGSGAEETDRDQGSRAAPGEPGRPRPSPAGAVGAGGRCCPGRGGPGT